MEYLEAMGGYVGAAGVKGVCRPVPSGALLYAPGAEREGARGSLYLVHGGSDPRDPGSDPRDPGSNGEESDGVWFVGVAELLARGDGSREYALSYDINTRARVEKGTHRGSFAPGPEQGLWPVSAQILWTVDHLVERRGWEPDALDRDGAADPGLLKRAFSCLTGERRSGRSATSAPRWTAEGHWRRSWGNSHWVQSAELGWARRSTRRKAGQEPWRTASGSSRRLGRERGTPPASDEGRRQ